MIYTVTLSPSIDYFIDVDDIKIGKVNRGENEEYIPGGKGVNVSILLNNLGIKTVATGFIGGFTGKYIKHTLNEMGVSNDFIEVDGFSRINVKINSLEETAINGSGVSVNRSDINLLIEKLNELDSEDIIVISGNVPKDLDSNVYETILEKLENKNIKVILDTTNKYLVPALSHNPFLVKPNKEELEEIVGFKIKNMDDLTKAAMDVLKLGAKNVIVSLGEMGAFMVGNDIKPIYEKPFDGEFKNSVGSGDSLVAGFIYGLLKTKDMHKALKYGVYAGSASAYSNKLAAEDELKEAFEKM